MKTLKGSLAVLFLMVTSMAFSQTYDDFDANMDGAMDRNEFNDTYSNNYDNWDRNQDGVVDDREFYDNNYDRLDANRDQILDADEWEQGYNDIYAPYLSTRDYDDFDTDANNAVSRDEYYSGMRDTDLYDEYDVDGDRYIDSDEMNEGVFNSMDENRDDQIDEDEYNKFGSYYLDAEY